MTEATVATEVMRRLKELLKVPVVFKHHDVSTGGVPDMSCTYGGLTFWVELKLVRDGEAEKRFRAHFDPLQLATCRLLERQGRCFYLLALEAKGERTAAALWSPARLDLALRDLKWPLDGRFHDQAIAMGWLSEVTFKLADHISRASAYARPL